MGKINLGDIFEIKTAKGSAYLHYVYVENTGRELVRVLPGLYSERPENLEELAKGKEQFLVFFPLSPAVKRKIVQKVATASSETFTMPQYMRSPHNVRNEFLGWFIINTSTWQRQLVKELTVEQKKMSDWATWNDTLLVKLLTEGWSLESWI